MLKARTWGERLVLGRGWRSRGSRWALVLPGVVFASVQLLAYAGSHELWRLWACATFVVMAVAGLERNILLGVLARAEQRLAELEGGSAPSRSGGDAS